MSLPEIPLGSVVRYYHEGWRTGYLENTKGQTMTIRPVAPREDVVVRCVKIPSADVTFLRVAHK